MIVDQQSLDGACSRQAQSERTCFCAADVVGGHAGCGFLHHQAPMQFAHSHRSEIGLHEPESSATRPGWRDNLSLLL